MKTTSHQYVLEAQKVQAKPIKGGTFTTSQRNLISLENPKFTLSNPGVGEYDLTNFKCLYKANETFFGPNHQKSPKNRRLGGPMFPV